MTKTEALNVIKAVDAAFRDWCGEDDPGCVAIHDAVETIAALLETDA